ncbi:hypothetical protein GCM10023080_097920 [Streptomyces pseudoechinosporeus]
MDSFSYCGPPWLIAPTRRNRTLIQPRAPDGALPEPPATMLTSPHVPAASHRREGPWAGASYARRLGSVSGNQDRVPVQGRMPGLRRADAPAHGPDPPTDPRGAGNGASNHHAPAPAQPPEAPRGELRDQPQPTRSRPTAGGNRLL